MSKNCTILKGLLLTGGLYFLAVSIAYMMRVKIPVLNIYYNVPSYGYEDRIISFLAFGWSVFMLSAAADPVENRSQVKAVLIAGIAATFGLHVINAITNFHKYAPDIHRRIFRFEALGLSAYVAALLYSYFLAFKGIEARESAKD